MARALWQTAQILFIAISGLLIAFVAYLWSQVGSDATTPALLFGGLALALLIAGRACGSRAH